MKMKPEDKETLRRERAAYQETRRSRNEIQELHTQVQELGGTVVTQNPPPTDTISVSQRSQVSQLSTSNTSIMGGRNEQTHLRQQRRAGAVSTQRHDREATPMHHAWQDPPVNTIAENECDTNADTCCLVGKNFLVLHATFRTADAYAYDMSIQPIENVPIVTGATAYDDPSTGTTYILVFNESLYYGIKLDHLLINPNQLRSYGIPLWDNPFDPMHSLSIEVDTSFHIPLVASGTKVGFRTRVPTPEELRHCEHIQMTSPHPWTNPTDVMMVQATHQGGRQPWKRRATAFSDIGHTRSEYLDAGSDEALLDSIDPSLARAAELLHRQHQLSQVDTIYDQIDTLARRIFVSNERHVKVSAELIADRFGIGPVRAQKTLRVTTQRGVRSAILPISRRYRADRIFA